MQKTIRFILSSLMLNLIIAQQGFGQQDFHQTYRFILHLNDLKNYNEGIYFIDQAIADASPAQKDTLNYFKGYFYYQLKEIDSSVNSFENVSSSNPTYFAQSKLLSSFQHAYAGNYEASKKLASFTFDSGLLNELKNFELAGIALLERDFITYNQYANSFTGNYYQLNNVEEKLKLNNEGLLQTKTKSPLLAGVLSGIVPGSGKFYVGKVGEGYTTLLISAILALQMREAYKKDGPSSTRFKLFTGIFGVVYVANIWGSVISVKTYRRELNETYDQAILVNMHLPLRTIFN